MYSRKSGKSLPPCSVVLEDITDLIEQLPLLTKFNFKNLLLEKQISGIERALKNGDEIDIDPTDLMVPIFLMVKSLFQNREKKNQLANSLNSENSWEIKSLFNLQYFNCPSCDFKNQSKQAFIDHIFEQHQYAIHYLNTNIDDESLNDVNCPWNTKDMIKAEYHFNDADPLDNETYESIDDHDKSNIETETTMHEENVNKLR